MDGVNAFRVPVGKKVDLKMYDPEDTGPFKEKGDVKEETERLKEKLADLQEVLYAQKEHAVLFVFQGMDCSGKDGVIRNVLSGLNPQGFNAHSFKSPTEEEKAHDFLWRAHREVPVKGYIAAFNRSYYEDVLITRVHGMVDDKEAERRFRHIGNFEELLGDSGVKVVKIFLNISKDFQIRKLHDRLTHPEKMWKFDKNDLVERKFWNQYRHAYEDAIRNCASEEAPWHIVPANNRWYRDYAVLQIAVDALSGLKLEYPKPDPELKSILKEMEGQ